MKKLLDKKNLSNEAEDMSVKDEKENLPFLFWKIDYLTGNFEECPADKHFIDI